MPTAIFMPACSGRMWASSKIPPPAPLPPPLPVRVMAFDQPVDGLHSVTIEQGIEMGRPSFIRLELDVENGAMTGGRIGGHAVVVARGRLTV